MGYVNLRQHTARLGAIASALFCGATLLTAAPAVAEPACSDIEVVFARGTGEPPGIGRVGDAFTEFLRPLVGGRTITSYGVDYPADYDFLTAQDGANDAAAHIAQTAAQCPGTKIVLGGYSQGAAAVDMLAGVPPLGNKIGRIAQAPPLDQSLVPRVSAVAVFGNPSAKFSLPLDSTGAFTGRSIDLCKDGDPICSRGRNPFAHSDYVTAGLAQQGASYVGGFI
jgi:cutinase